MTSKLRDFNLLKMADISSNSTTNNNLSVVVNTREPMNENTNNESNSSENDSELKFYKLLSSTLSNILKDNNPKLIINLIDQSGKIIIEAQTLIELIAIKTNSNPQLVNIQYGEVEEIKCNLGKVSPIKNIKNIKIDNENFNLKYNKEYNILQDEFNISLDKVIIPINA